MVPLASRKAVVITYVATRLVLLATVPADFQSPAALGTLAHDFTDTSASAPTSFLSFGMALASTSGLLRTAVGVVTAGDPLSVDVMVVAVTAFVGVVLSVAATVVSDCAAVTTNESGVTAASSEGASVATTLAPPTVATVVSGPIASVAELSLEQALSMNGITAIAR